jgi:phosphatidylserine/phosphatidylglycerophosphate/cardiolipin synthase-like enzyme
MADTETGVLLRCGYRFLLTAAEAYPALEAAFLAAETEIWASFLVFDPSTQLRSEQGLAVGHTWFDLIVDTLKRGVHMNIVVSDFDPVGAPRLHRASWRSVRMFIAAAELAGSKRLTVTAALHPGEASLPLRLLAATLAVQRRRKVKKWLFSLSESRRRAAVRDMPGLARALGLVRTLPKDLSPAGRFWPCTHHQKMAVFDRKLLYIGGLDLNDRRYDTPDHDQPGSETWHDIQIMTDGPAVTEAQAHLETFLEVVAGSQPPQPARHLLRTISRPRRRSRIIGGIETVVDDLFQAHLSEIGRAERLIYLETQYFRDVRVARALAARARAVPELALILILPAAPDDVAFEGNTGLDARYGEFLQARCIRILRKAFGPRLFVGGPAQPRPARKEKGRAKLLAAPIIYVHAKLSIFDDNAAIVSSANLNARSFCRDTEAGIRISRAPEVSDLRQRAMAHWLPASAGRAPHDPATAVAAWTELAAANARRSPAKRDGFLLPYDLGAAESFGRNIPVIPDDMV